MSESAVEEQKPELTNEEAQALVDQGEATPGPEVPADAGGAGAQDPPAPEAPAEGDKPSE